MNRVLALLNLARLSADQEVEIQSFLKEPFAWDLFFKRVQSNAVQVLTTQRLQEVFGMTNLPSRFQGESTPFQMAAALKESGEQRAQWAQNFLAQMHQAGIEVIVLKGGVLGSTIYQRPVYKKMNDIDILVRFEQAADAARILKELGFYCVGDLFGEKEISSKTHHAPPYVSPDLKCAVGLHWGIHSKYSRWNADLERIWEKKVPVQIMNAPAYRMSWEENLLHLCIHLPFYKIGLRELADVYNLILFCDPAIQWDEFKRLAQKWGAYDPVYRVLSLANAWMELNLPKGFLDEFRLQASRFCILDTEKRISSQEVLMDSRSVYFSKIEKAFLVLRLSQNSTEKIKAWAATWYFTFCPPHPELIKLAGVLQLDSPRDRFLARARAPYQLLSVMAREHGTQALIAVTLYNIGIVIREIMTFSFLKNGQTIAQHPARKLLEVVE